MTKEDLQLLSEYETNFKTAINSNYTRNIVKSKIEKMLEIYKRETGENYILCTHCSSSVLTFLKKIGKLYFEKVQEGNENNLNINELENIVAKMENKEVKINKRNAKHTSK